MARITGTTDFRYPDHPVVAILHEVAGGYTDLTSFHAAISASLSKLPSSLPKPTRLLPPSIPDTPENVTRMNDMLSFMDPDSKYEVWRNICWAVAASA